MGKGIVPGAIKYLTNLVRLGIIPAGTGATAKAATERRVNEENASPRPVAWRAASL
jgi:hypothetical protein